MGVGVGEGGGGNPTKASVAATIDHLFPMFGIHIIKLSIKKFVNYVLFHDDIIILWPPTLTDILAPGIPEVFQEETHLRLSMLHFITL